LSSDPWQKIRKTAANGKHNDEVQLRAFDVLAMDGDDLRNLPLSMRKTNLARLLMAGQAASSSATLNRARSDQTCFVRPVSLG